MTKPVLIVGAGETAELVARALVARGADTVFIANRRYDRAIGLAQRFGGQAVRIDEMPLRLADADIVVSAPHSPHHIVEHGGKVRIGGAFERPDPVRLQLMRLPDALDGSQR